MMLTTASVLAYSGTSSTASSTTSSNPVTLGRSFYSSLAYEGRALFPIEFRFMLFLLGAMLYARLNYVKLEAKLV